ncbi:2-phospho-L-lactate guanylyltransferase [Hamadaea flava]|uniref:2-phospho-L-lactate guanylyltransferase n=1 Tax=Hamadaea flava TaxID=1742688 RepID=A0ABV8LIT7_9ACTN|nr:2-phospho-L-lactate guanylyltransferase [Hamadaea flava]MCP2324988.1 2-phospho-L-lactate guanylyltransferase [Hamadaea flava]
MLPVGWSLLVPLKALPRAKTRLRGALAGVGHERLVVALALSTVRAAQRAEGVAEVVVVTGDERLRRELTPLGVRFADDAGSLNDSLVAAAEARAGLPVAALTGDVPALRPVELAEALALAEVRSFVPDLPGDGTVLLAAPAGATLRPLFGPDSAAAHARSGANRLDGLWPTLRRDVDTPADLADAVDLGWIPDLS